GRVHNEKVSLHATSEGRVVLHSGTMAMGQGLQTTYTQMVSDSLGIAMDKIDIVQGDTDLATGFGSVGSRSLFVGGTALAVSAGDLITKAREKASNLLETSVEDIEYRDGVLSVVGTDRRISLFEIAQKEQGAKLSVDSEGEVDGPSWPNGTHICEVEIDPDTGVTTIARYTVVDDFGAVINPLLLEGQVHGGIVQGIGQALLEETVYDNDSGQLLSGTFMDYAMPRADNLPFFSFATRNVPCKANPLGIKGAGEAGAIGAPPALINAIVDALHKKAGVRHVDMPATPRRVWDALHGAAA
ncbi:MAG: molybdopterin-dependent oxidoreductase, partial [Xanthobacteraceae bacterium]|nr:molybdopterin-dependent oxidoreductase [Xanthobacteraceae bacterium]